MIMNINEIKNSLLTFFKNDFTLKNFITEIIENQKMDMFFWEEYKNSKQWNDQNYMINQFIINLLNEENFKNFRKQKYYFSQEKINKKIQNVLKNLYINKDFFEALPWKVQDFFLKEYNKNFFFKILIYLKQQIFNIFKFFIFLIKKIFNFTILKILKIIKINLNNIYKNIKFLHKMIRERIIKETIFCLFYFLIDFFLLMIELTVFVLGFFIFILSFIFILFICFLLICFPIFILFLIFYFINKKKTESTIKKMTTASAFIWQPKNFKIFSFFLNKRK